MNTYNYSLKLVTMKDKRIAEHVRARVTYINRLPVNFFAHDAKDE